MTTETAETYNYNVVKQFAIMTVVWGIVGMLVGVVIAAQLVWPQLNFDTPWLTFGRLRPLHTNAVVFAFGGCALVCNFVLRGSAYLPCQAFFGQAGSFYLLGLAGGYCTGCNNASHGPDYDQRICRTRVAD